MRNADMIRATVMQQRAQGTTVVMIAHDLSTVRHADNIVVLKDSRVAEQAINSSSFMFTTNKRIA
jgi:ABC-type multidrug transport system fused ATPase/permease subunit